MDKGDIIKHEDVAEDDVAGNLRESIASVIPFVDKLNASLIETAKLTKGKLANFASPQDVKQVEDLNKEVTKADLITKSYAKSVKLLTVEEQKQKIVQTEKNKQTKEEAKDQLGLISVYQKAAKQLNDLRNAYKEMELQGKANSDVGKQLLEVIQAQDTKLKVLDATVGQHHRNIGNYTKSILVLQKGLGGLTGLIATVGQAFGFETESFERLHQVSKTLIKTGRELHHTLELEELGHASNTKAIIEETAATEAETVATEEQGVASMAAVGVWGLVALAVGAVALGIWAMVDSKKEDITYTKEEIKVLYEYMRATKEQTEFNKALADAKKARGGDLPVDEEIKALYEKLDAEKEIGGQEVDQMKRELDQMKARGDGEEYLFAQGQKIKKAELAALQQRQKDLGIYAAGDFELQKEIADKKSELYVAQLEYEHKIHLAEEKDLADWAKRMEDIYNSVYQKDFNKADEMKLKKVDSSETDGTAEFNARVANNLKKLEADKEFHDKEIDAALKTAKQIDEIFSKYLANRIERQQGSLDREMTNIDNAISIQQKRFNEGLSNTLAFEQREKAKSQEKQAALDKKAHREKQAEQIAEVFMEFIKVYAKDGPAGLGKALAATFGVKTMEMALAGSAFEGTEDTGTGKGMDNKNGMLYMVHPHERILSEEHNKMLGGISNDELVDRILTDNSMFVGVNTPENLQGSDLSLMRLVSEMKEVKQAIEDKPVFNWDVNKYDELVQRKLEKGNVEVKTFKRWGGTA